MKLSKHKLSNDQPKSLSRRDDKKSVNIKWNSKLYFQLSLILSLLIVYSVMQTKFEIKEKALVIPEIDILEEPPMITYTVEKLEKIKKKRVVKKQPKKKIIEKIIKVKNSSNSDTDLSKFNKPLLKEEDILQKSIPTTVNPKENKVVSVLGVEHAPVFPGCETLPSNIEKRNCLSKKITKFIQKKFDTDKFDDVNTKGKQKISVQFYIDENGYVTEIKARAIDKLLEKEAIRVISKLPKMEPGRQGDQVVKVQYMIPIVFRID